MPHEMIVNRSNCRQSLYRIEQGASCLVIVGRLATVFRVALEFTVLRLQLTVVVEVRQLGDLQFLGEAVQRSLQLKHGGKGCAEAWKLTPLCLQLF